MKRGYSCRWISPGGSTVGSVSFMASNDAQAKAKARKTGDEIKLPNTRFMLHEGTRLVEDRIGGGK